MFCLLFFFLDYCIIYNCIKHSYYFKFMIILEDFFRNCHDSHLVVNHNPSILAIKKWWACITHDPINTCCKLFKLQNSSSSKIFIHTCLYVLFLNHCGYLVCWIFETSCLLCWWMKRDSRTQMVALPGKSVSYLD